MPMNTARVAMTRSIATANQLCADTCSRILPMSICPPVRLVFIEPFQLLAQLGGPALETLQLAHLLIDIGDVPGQILIEFRRGPDAGRGAGDALAIEPEHAPLGQNRADHAAR